MRIVFLLTQDLSSPSGLGRYLPWAKELYRLGYEVQIIALHPNYSSLQERETIIGGVQVKYVAQMHIKKMGSLKTYFSPLHLIWIALMATIQLSRMALINHPDVVINGKPHPMNGLATIVIKFFRPRIKIIVDCDDIEIGSNKFQNEFQKRIIAWFENHIPKIAHIVTTNTYYNLNRLERMGVPADRLIYLPNGVDLDRFPPPPKKEVDDLRDQLCLTGKRVVSFIGSLSLTSHPVNLLLQAFKIVRQEIRDIELILVGGGEDVETLQYLAKDLGIEDCVTFVGRVPPEKVSHYYALSEVTVDPVYDDEAARGRCPLKMFESWACGVPFVTGDVGDRKKLMSNPQSGLLNKSGDPADLAKSIIILISDREFASKITSYGREKVKDYYWSNLLNKILSIF